MGAQTTEQPDSVGCLTIDIAPESSSAFYIDFYEVRSFFDFSLFVDFSVETQVSL